MSRPHDTVLNALKRELPRGKRLLIGVSGGVDSVCLLHACLELLRTHKLLIEVAHIDHRLRPTSGTDAKFVEALARSHNLPFHLKRAVRPPARSNLEAWGRKIRYDFFRETLATRKLDFVLTAHTANDVAETFLMRLISNKEPNSILKLDPVRHCLRPLLTVSRKEVLRYAKTKKLQWVEDESNQDLKFLRNQIRHELIPFLEQKFDPRITETLALRALALAADVELLKHQVDPAIDRLSEIGFGSKAWLRALRKEIETVPKGLQWRFAEALMKEKLGFNLGRNKSDLLLAVLKGKRNAVELPHGHRVKAFQGGIKLLLHENSPLKGSFHSQ